MESWILITLVTIPGVWSGNWGVRLENQCALKGMSTVIKCTYDYPSMNIVTSVTWYKAIRESRGLMLYRLSSLRKPRGHFEYQGDRWSDCKLKINNVQWSDEGSYYFGFETTLNRWTSRTHAYLSVKELTTVVQPSTVTEGERVNLTCVSGCSEPMDVVWFRDGQPVSSVVFQASRRDAGRYHCAILGQEHVKSAPVALNVQYAPEKVKLSLSPVGDIMAGDTVTFTCSSDANPPVTESGYSLYKDGEFIGSGQSHSISDIQPGHMGRYYCQAWNNVSRMINSTEVLLDVKYPPMNISVSMDPPHVVEGDGVNLTCSSSANPAADNYTWYKRTAPSSSSSLLQVGSGQMLSLPVMTPSHAGLYMCQVRNTAGVSNSTEVQLVMVEKQSDSPPFPILAGIGVSFVVTLVIAALLFWKKWRTSADKKNAMTDLKQGGEEPIYATTTDAVYASVHMGPTSAPLVSAQASASLMNSHHHNPTLDDDEVTYTTVTINPRNKMNNGRTPQDTRCKPERSDDTVIYATVVT
ncbi:B-cell receptor CD22-like isoform X2 [Mugil cephalus]|uniref:B-cell receptor CD22-like isoform X2 n=1 Tax=Mugil cephalus TaxID=48193 RepID=UPI001FB678E3|nr:B-cell receptor CD22-like isoform X2 [Mugil cephalus]